MNNIDIYYESIKQVFEQIKNWKRPKPPLREKFVDAILGTAISLFIASLIPIFPTALIMIGGLLNAHLFTIGLKNQYLRQLWAGRGLRNRVNSAQAGDLLENLG